MKLNGKALKDILSKITLQSAGEKREDIEECCKCSDSSDVYFPSLYLNTKQVPKLEGKEVDDEITLIISGKITGHNLNEGAKNKRESFDIQINKVGIV